MIKDINIKNKEQELAFVTEHLDGDSIALPSLEVLKEIEEIDLTETLALEEMNLFNFLNNL